MFQPDQTLADFLKSLDFYSFQTSDQTFNEVFFLNNSLNEHELIQMNYCLPLEKNIYLNKLFSLFLQSNQQTWKALYIDMMLNYNFHLVEGDKSFIKTIQILTLSELIIVLKAIRARFKKNELYRLIVLDIGEILRKKKDSDVRVQRTIKQRFGYLEREQANLIWDLIQGLCNDYKVAIIVLQYQSHIKENIKHSQEENTIIVSPRVLSCFLSFNTIMMIPISLVDEKIYQKLVDKIIRICSLNVSKDLTIQPQRVVLVIKLKDEQLVYDAVLMCESVILLESGKVLEFNKPLQSELEQ